MITQFFMYSSKKTLVNLFAVINSLPLYVLLYTVVNNNYNIVTKNILDF